MEGRKCDRNVHLVRNYKNTNLSLRCVLLLRKINKVSKVLVLAYLIYFPETPSIKAYKLRDFGIKLVLSKTIIQLREVCELQGG